MREILLEADDIHKALLKRNKNHFWKAADTPFGSGELYDLVGFTGLNKAADAIVDGTFMEEYGADMNLLPEMEQLIAQLAMPKMIKNLEEDIPSKVREGDYIDGFKKWTESTSTSPSGHHLGHYKAIVNDPLKATRDLNFVDLYVKAINLPLKYGFVPSRWCNSVTVMIEKDPGSPRIERLRIIHLFEADYNFCLKLLWGCRMVYQGVKHGCFGHQQYGSRPRHQAIDTVHRKALTFDLSRILRTNLGLLDNDALGCFNRIVVSLGMIALQ